MEQTLGKRIMAHRKRLGMTQEQLAERLGVTPQAVSKWENDQSCPDIATLPVLADIFGISTDALLGREEKESTKVHTAEVVDKVEIEDDDNHKWEFHWDGGKKGAVTVAVFVLLVGVLLIVSRIFELSASFWDIAWPTAFLVFFGSRLLTRFSAFSAAATLLGGYYLIENMDLYKIDKTELFFPALIVLFGIGLLIDALRKPRKSGFSFRRKGGNKDGKFSSNYSTDEESFDCSVSFGQLERVIILPRLSSGTANCSFGELILDLSGCQEIAENCHLELNCSFGELVLRVPRQYKVIADNNAAFGAVSFNGEPDSDLAATVWVNANVSFGEISVEYI